MMIRIEATRTWDYPSHYNDTGGESEVLPPFYLNPGTCDGYTTDGRVTKETLRATVEELCGENKETTIDFKFSYAGMLSP